MVEETSRRPEARPPTWKLSGCASVVPIKLVPSTVPLFPVVLHPPAALMPDQLALVPLVVKNLPLFPDCDGAKALNAFVAVV